ncbi:phosphonopyruvate decarboxylase [Olivibacter sp. SDN3]|uniref:phosphonopyruvate decarboxylase n=1 Tax=Olivibacter sp. SDN3 TaxID=2764720 RepID=UPI0016511DDE|nr:phosphonopyruvate decarboxylase [Olivibacter sp. SDN3]QNL47743.1 phosphonopyruvate decarboxylase [Olivibacter sp. SDN3]
MINCESFLIKLNDLGIRFYTGVPDSLLKDIGAYIADHADSSQHIIAANEGAAVGLAAGYHLATGAVPMVYLQNSGLGNTINPLLSLADQEVYSIPMLMMIGWRGEPGKKDEPQHIKQGRVQNALLDAMEIPYRVIDHSDAQTIDHTLQDLVSIAKRENRPVALVVSANTFAPYKLQHDVKTNFPYNREQALEVILQQIPAEAIVVSTTGKTSREVFEIRKKQQQSGATDFLTVGSMGHANQIAVGIALHSNKPVYCLDGDGAVLMHMGSLAIAGLSNANNLHHIVLNNGAHDSVGGQPTAGFEVDFKAIALGCGYRESYSMSIATDIEAHIRSLDKEVGPTFTEIKVNKGARKDLGRPTSTPLENKQKLMQLLQS